MVASPAPAIAPKQEYKDPGIEVAVQTPPLPVQQSKKPSASPSPVRIIPKLAQAESTPKELPSVERPAPAQESVQEKEEREEDFSPVDLRRASESSVNVYPEIEALR